MFRDSRPSGEAVLLIGRTRRSIEARPVGVGFLAFAFVLAILMQACAPHLDHAGDGSIAASAPQSGPARLEGHRSAPADDDPCCFAVPTLIHQPNTLVAIATDGELRFPTVDAVAFGAWRGWPRAPHLTRPSPDAADRASNGTRVYLTTLRLRI